MGHLRRQGNLFEVLAPKFRAKPVPSTPEDATALIRSRFYDDLPGLERLLSHVAREMSSNVGLFCLSRRYKSLPMWAHYAGNAAGLAVQFRDLDKVFPGDETGDETGVLRKPIGVCGKPTGILGMPISVRYEQHRHGGTEKLDRLCRPPFRWNFQHSLFTT